MVSAAADGGVLTSGDLRYNVQRIDDLSTPSGPPPPPDLLSELIVRVKAVPRDPDVADGEA
jgi:hypothetical protein